MKNLKILSLCLLVAMLFVTFTACSSVGSAGSFNKLYDKNYVPEDLSYNKATAIADLEGYVMSSMSEEFAIFTSAAEGALTYKVYSFASQSVVKTLTSNATTVYTVSLCGDLPAFFVTSSAAGSASAPEAAPAALEEGSEEGENAENAPSTSTPTEAKVTSTIYDAEGVEITSSTEKVGAPISLDDMLIFDFDIYVLDEEGKLVKSENSIPEYLTVIDFDYCNEDYVYTIDGDTVAVYDRTFVPVSSWTAPSYAEDLAMFVLDNGYVFAQYARALDANDDEYDFLEYNANGVVEKFDLVSLVINVKNGNTSEVDLKYVVKELTASKELEEMPFIGEAYSDSIKNIAYVCPIIDGQVDESELAADIVLMDNNCKSLKSLKLAAQQTASYPQKLNSDYFMVDTVYGKAIVKANGKDVYSITNKNVTANSEYIIGEKAIYDINTYEVVYDLEKEDAEVINVMNTAVFVRKGDIATSYKVLMLRGEKTTEICSYDVKTNTGKLFAAVDGLGCYSLYDVAAGEYKYYNLDGDVLATSKYVLLPCAFSFKYNTMIVCDLENGVGYYALTNVEAKKK